MREQPESAASMITIQRLGLCLAVALSVCTNAFAQEREYSRETTPTNRTQAASPMVMPTSAAPALDGPVDPDRYYIGPSDVLTLSIWINPPLTVPLTVNPEGTVVIPSVGEVRVTDLTLNQARALILKEVRRKYIGGEPTLTLTTPRKVIVTVTGGVRVPGRYILNATDRADRAIEEANMARTDMTEVGMGSSAAQLAGGPYNASRTISLRRRSGEVMRVDLPKFAVSRDGQWNPFLREGDEVFVPGAHRSYDVFGVSGGVRYAGEFELVPGDSLLGAIELAYGTTPRAIRDSVLFSRYVSQVQQEMTVIDLDAIERGVRPNIRLAPGDRIVVLERRDSRENLQVIVSGEVKFPGVYPIMRDRTRLSHIIRMAGGFTSFASLSSAEVIRGTTGGDRLERLLVSRGNISADDSTYYALESELRMNKEIVDVDFPKLVNNADSTQDVILESGDRIVVPSIRRSIYVFGQVVVPGNIPFVPGEDVRYYIRKAGGYTDNARSGDVTIIKNATRQWLAPGETTIQEGDYVWVPKVVAKSFSYYMSIIGQTASVISVAVSVILLTIQLRK